jgi:hypothetical protein
MYIANEVIIFSHKDEQCMSFAGKWIELKIIMLRELSQTQEKIISHVSSHMCNLDILKRQECKRVTAWGWGKGEG